MPDDPYETLGLEKTEPPRLYRGAKLSEDCPPVKTGRFNQPAIPGLRDAMKKKVTRREQFLSEMDAVVPCV